MPRVQPSDVGGRESAEAPLVSVVLATYNRAERITGAIESVLAQTYEHVELLVVDDGSTDDTAGVLREYEGNDRVRVLSNDANRGIPATRNRGIDAANGTYIAIIDDDDRWHPRKLERQVAAIESLPETFYGVYAEGVITDGDGTVLEHVATGAAGDIYPEVLVEMSILPHSSQLLRRDCVEAVGRFDTDFDIASDWDLAIRLAERWQVGLVPEVLVERHHHESNVTGDPGYDVRARRKIREKYADRIADSEITDDFVAAEHRELGLLALSQGRREDAFRQLAAASRRQTTIEHLALTALALSGEAGVDKVRHLRDRIGSLERDAYSGELPTESLARVQSES